MTLVYKRNLEKLEVRERDSWLSQSEAYQASKVGVRRTRITTEVWGIAVISMRNATHRLMHLNSWSLVSGAIWEQYGTFRTYSHDGETCL